MKTFGQVPDNYIALSPFGYEVKNNEIREKLISLAEKNITQDNHLLLEGIAMAKKLRTGDFAPVEYEIIRVAICREEVRCLDLANLELNYKAGRDCLRCRMVLQALQIAPTEGSLKSQQDLVAANEVAIR